MSVLVVTVKKEWFCNDAKKKKNFDFTQCLVKVKKKNKKFLFVYLHTTKCNLI